MQYTNNWNDSGSFIISLSNIRLSSFIKFWLPFSFISQPLFQFPVQDVSDHQPGRQLGTENNFQIISCHPCQYRSRQRSRCKFTAVSATHYLFPCGILHQQIDPATAIPGPLKFTFKPFALGAETHTQLIQGKFPFNHTLFRQAKVATVWQRTFYGIVAAVQLDPFIREADRLHPPVK